MTAIDRPDDDSGTEYDQSTAVAEPTNFGGRQELRTPDEAPIGAVDRRDYLKAVGAAGLAGSLAGASSSPVAAQQGWEAAAEDRIEQHRKSDLEVVVEDESGNPVSDASVDVEMQRHEFGFGTAVHAEFLTNGTEWGNSIDGLDDSDQEMYQDTVEELFNEIVLENYHKWNIWENDWQNPDEDPGGGAPDDIVDWAVQHNMDVRGHVCIWGDVGSYAVPPDVAEAMGVDPNSSDFDHDDFTTPNHDPQLIRDRSLEQVERIIDYYGEDIKEWEVVNEVINVPEMIRAVEGNGTNDQSVDPETAPILGDWYERAEEVAGQYDVPVAVNDYNTMAGNYTGTRDEYHDQISYLVEDRGIDLNGIGFQCHFNTNETLTPDQILSNMDDFAEYGAGLRTTEFDLFQGDWSDQQQADYLRQYLKTFFSHEAAEDFLVWGHWTALHWGEDYGGEQPNAPFYTENWDPKPALTEYEDLVFGEWWTEESATTGSDGGATIAAFHGDHDATVTAGDADPVTERVSVSDGGTQVTITVSVDGGPEPSGCDDLPDDQVEEVDGQTVCDVDGDGFFRDVTADGNVGQGDVAEFFSKQHRGAWKQPDMFDFSENGAVTHGDVVELFDYVGLNG